MRKQGFSVSSNSNHEEERKNLGAHARLVFYNFFDKIRMDIK